MRFIKRPLSVFLSLLMAFSVFALAVVPASAAEEESYYNVRLRFHLDTHCDDTDKGGTDGTFVKIKFRPNNGTSDEEVETFLCGTTTAGEQGYDPTDPAFYTYLQEAYKGQDVTTEPVEIPGFPTWVKVSVRVGGGAFNWKNVKLSYIYLQVQKSNGEWVDIVNLKPGSNLSLTNQYNKTVSTEETIDSSYYPYLTDVGEINGADEITIPTNLTAQTSTYSLSAVDQYGVNWVNCNWTSNNANATNNANVRSNTVTFKYPADSKDYDVNLTATLPNRTGSDSVVKTKSVHVKVPHKITIDPNGGVYNGSSSVITNYMYTGDTLTLGTPEDRVGYTFTGWTMPDGWNGVVQNDNAAFVANWSANSYELTFDYNDTDRVGEASPKTTTTLNVNYDSTLTLPAPALTGYKFLGWQKEDGTYLKTGDKYQIADDTKLTAQWEKVVYTITFDLKDGEFVDPDFAGDSITYTIEDTVTIPNPVKEGYTFTGWQLKPAPGYTWETINWDGPEGGEDAIDVEIDEETGFVFSERYGSIVLTAQGTVNEYTIEFDYNTKGMVLVDGELDPIDDYTVTHNDIIEDFPADPELKGYEFLGWFYLNGDPYTPDIPFTRNTKLLAHWKAVEYTVTYDCDNGTENESATYTIEDKDAVTLPTPEKTGYHLTGWVVSSSEDNNWVKTIDKDATDVEVYGKYGNVTLTAQWEINKYTVKFYTEDGQLLSEQEVEYGKDATAPEAQTKAPDAENHYTFNHWNGYTNVTKDIDIYASFTAEAHNEVKDKAVAPSCEASGLTEGSHCSDCDYVIKAQEKVEPTGHKYSAPEWTWSADYTTAAAKFSCSQCDSVETVTDFNPTENLVTAADCENNKVVTYTAKVTFNNENYENTSAEVTVPETATEHNYQFVEFEWAEDGTTAKAKLVCENDDSHILYEDAEMSSDPHAATCEEDAYTVYTATYEENQDTNTVTEKGTATGHKWSVEWSWDTESNPVTATATFTCENDQNHKDTVKVNAEIETTDAECGKAGSITYKAVVNKDGKDYSADKTVETDALAHNWQVTWTWSEDHLTATAHFVCSRDDSHTDEVTGIAATEVVITPADCLTNKVVKYTATVTKDGQTFNGETEEITLDKDPNTHASAETYLKEDTVKEATCLENGYTGDYYYVCCDTLAVEGKTTEKTGHTEGDMVTENKVDPTCTVEGSYDEVIRCTVCGEVISRVTKSIEKTAHTPGEAKKENVKAATCTEEGSYDEVVYCTVCHEELSSTPKTTAKAAHTWSSWVTVTPATPTSDGLQQRTCSVCGEVEERTTQISGEKNRQIQFVVASGMYYVVHMDVDRIIQNKSASAVYWYKDVDLNFEVVTGAAWNYENYVVLVNGEALEANADGSYTLPGGSTYAQINITPIITPSEGSGSGTENGPCKYCGKTHANTLWGRIVAFFHAIFYWIKSLFTR